MGRSGVGGFSKAARAICACCDVRRQCLKCALSDPCSVEWGIYGGTSPREGRELLARASSACAAQSPPKSLCADGPAFSLRQIRIDARRHSADIPCN
jgi:hypothetical protein